MRKKKKWYFEDYLVWGYFGFCIASMIAWIIIFLVVAGWSS